MGLDFEGTLIGWSYIGYRRFRESLEEQLRAVASDLDDPITILLESDDTRGEWTPEQCAKMAPRLRELVANLTDFYDKTNGDLLAQEMEKHAKAGTLLKWN